MIKVSEHITLTPITIEDQEQLMRLMQRIYPPAYAHYWKDDCSWYLNAQYGKENLAQELTDPNGKYYFVYSSLPTRQVRARLAAGQESIIGILRLIAPCMYKPLPGKTAFKVHRIYLGPDVQGQGVGKKLMAYAENQARIQGYDLLWLDAMDTHKQAQAFYARLGFEKTELQQLDFSLLHEEHRPMWYMHKNL